MGQIILGTEKALEELLGSKHLDGKFYIEENISVVVQEQSDSPFLWIEDRRGIAFAWLFNIVRTENGFNYFSDKGEYIECQTLPEVFSVVKKRAVIR